MGPGLIIGAGELAAIRERAASAWPEECCGILVGRRATPAGAAAPGGPSRNGGPATPPTTAPTTPAASPTAPATVPAEVVRVFAADNVAEGERRRRFEVDPRVLFAAHRYARGAGLAVLGPYHSHPDGSAVPSAMDAARAVEPGEIWLIVAVGAGAAGAAAAGEVAAHLFTGEGFAAIPLRTD